MEKDIKKFGEFKINEDTDNESNPEVKVKDLINFLNRFDPETKVYLDKDGWQRYSDSEDINDVISYLIDDSPIKLRGKDYLMINN